MATILPPLSTSKRKVHSLRIDMTPMVDLGFLLITFFIFTAALSEPAVTKLIMPKEGEEMPVPQSKAMTVLLDRDKAYVYEGRWEEMMAARRLTTTTYERQNGLGSLIRQKQARLEDKKDLVVLIKPLATARYQNILDALDEMQINRVRKYAVVEPTRAEMAEVARQ